MTHFASFFIAIQSRESRSLDKFTHLTRALRTTLLRTQGTYAPAFLKNSTSFDARKSTSLIPNNNKTMQFEKPRKIRGLFILPREFKKSPAPRVNKTRSRASPYKIVIPLLQRTRKKLRHDKYHIQRSSARVYRTEK